MQEIEGLIERLNILKEVHGAGLEEAKPKYHEDDAFLDAQRNISVKIKDIRLLINQRNELSGRGGNRRMIIETNSNIRKQMADVTKDFGSVKELLEDDLKSRKKKLTDDEKKVRIGLVDDLLKQIEELRKTSNEQVAGANQEIEGDVNPFVDSTFVINEQDETISNQKEELFSAKPAMPSLSKYKGVDVVPTADLGLTEGQQQGMAMIDKNDQEIDQMVEVIGDGLDVLKEIAMKMNDELQVQSKKLDIIDEHMGGNQNTLDKNTKTLKETLVKAQNEDKLCFTLILIMIIVGLGLVIYNWVK